MENSSDSKVKTVLIVDDDSYICILFEAILGKEGFKTVAASNGEEALKIVRSQPLDLIILDWMMPVLSGFDVLKTLKKDEKREIPVIVITAHVSDKETIHLILNELNASDFMTKPVDHSDFIARVRRILNTTPANP